MTYPTGFAVRNIYKEPESEQEPQNGYLLKVERASDNHVYWQADKRNARGQLEQITLGNGLVTQKGYDNLTGRIQQIQTTGVQDLSFTFDRIGNLIQRTKDDLVENFGYDSLNRLTKTSVIDGYSTTIGYDALGNITYKSEVGNYSYGARPHAVTAVSGVINKQYRYDANGNRISSTTGTVAYTSFNKPHTITEGHTTLQFLYGPNYSRYQQTVIKDGDTQSTKTYIGGVYEQEITDTLTKEIHYIFAGGESIAIETQQSDDENTTRYLHKDHLGSIDAITDEQGALAESLSFDAWGKRRSENWKALTDEELRTLLEEGLTTPRGFTGHEQLDEVQLIHMNGRVYDPVIGRFLTADPFVQAPANMQNLNRYSYVLNNPLSLVDPSGFNHDYNSLGSWATIPEKPEYIPDPEFVIPSKKPEYIPNSEFFIPSENPVYIPDFFILEKPKYEITIKQPSLILEQQISEISQGSFSNNRTNEFQKAGEYLGHSGMGAEAIELTTSYFAKPNSLFEGLSVVAKYVGRELTAAEGVLAGMNVIQNPKDFEAWGNLVLALTPHSLVYDVAKYSTVGIHGLFTGGPIGMVQEFKDINDWNSDDTSAWRLVPTKPSEQSESFQHYYWRNR